MENDPVKNWSGFLFNLFKETDDRYVKSDGEYPLIRMAVFSGIGLILVAFVAGLAAIAFGKLHIGS